MNLTWRFTIAVFVLVLTGVSQAQQRPIPLPPKGTDCWSARAMMDTTHNAYICGQIDAALTGIERDGGKNSPQAAKLKKIAKDESCAAIRDLVDRYVKEENKGK